MILFPDTNFFLHFKDPTEIPWSEVTDDDEVILVICGNTQGELDKKKFELRGRAQRRARKWVIVIGEMISTETVKTLRVAGPRVTLDLYLDPPSDWTAPEILDVSRLGDDLFIANLLAYRHATGNDCVLLTADTGPLGKAKRLGVPVVSSNRSTWELPPETDERHKEIRRLKQDLEEARQANPEIELKTLVDGASAHVLSINVRHFPALTEEQVSGLLQELEQLHPRITEFPRPEDEPEEKKPRAKIRGFDIAKAADAFDWVEPSNEEIAAYNQVYDAWLADARQLMETVPASLQEKTFNTGLAIHLSNSGGAPAEDVLVSFEASADLFLAEKKPRSPKGEQDKTQKQIAPTALRKAPTPPSWKKIYRRPALDDFADHRRDDALSILRRAAGAAHLTSVESASQALARLTLGINVNDHLGLGALGYGASARGVEAHLTSSSLLDGMPSSRPNIFQMPESHNREKFYPKGRSALNRHQKLEFECSLLRHRIQPQSWTILVSTHLDALPANGGSITLIVHARNLRKPVEVVVPIRITAHDEPSESIVRALLPLGGPS